MSAKINELLDFIGPGGRSNKYRIHYPGLGKVLDVVTKSTNMPGRDISVAEVFVRGRKYQLAAEVSEDGTWEIEIYNNEFHSERNFFLGLIDDTNSYNVPEYLDATLGAAGSPVGDLIDSGLNVWNAIRGQADRSSTFITNQGAPWYQQDIVIEQLNHDEVPVSRVILNHAFVTSVGSIEYSDEIGDVTTSTISFAYSGLDVD